MKERWEYLGADVAESYHPEIDGKRCYWYFHVKPGSYGGSVLYVIPVDEFWP